MKEIDFLPEWYKAGKRRRAHMRTQYVALTLVFIGMMTHNLTSAHKIDRASAEVARLDGRRIHAESMMQQFKTISTELSKYQKKSSSIEHVDSRIDMAAVLAEISHVIGDDVVLSRVDFSSESISGGDTGAARRSTSVRVAAKRGKADESMALGDVKFRITLAGITNSPGEVGGLVYRLEESPYFHQVLPSFSLGKDIQVSARRTAGGSPGDANRSTAGQTVKVRASEFEIVCYLSNYEEIDRR